MNNLKDAARLIRETAHKIPIGGVISIRRDHNNISAYNLAEHIARTLEDIMADRDIYGRLRDDPPNVEVTGATQFYRAASAWTAG